MSYKNLSPKIYEYRSLAYETFFQGSYTNDENTKPNKLVAQIH
jgi:hypothetical protein